MAKKKPRAAEDPSKVTQILLAGLLLKEEPRPDVRQLERLIHVDSGTLSELFRQRKPRRKKTKPSGNASNSETTPKVDTNPNV